MSRRRRRALDGVVPAAPAAGTLTALAQDYAAHLTMRAYAAEVVGRTRRRLAGFTAWAEQRGAVVPAALTREHVQAFARALETQPSKRGGTLPVGSQRGRLETLQGFCAWLERNGQITNDPAADVILPRKPRDRPRLLLSQHQVEHLMLQPDTGTPEGLRDRAILEMFYSTGLRRAELARLRLGDVQARSGAVHVVSGKGGKDRVVPIGARALRWLDVYLRDSRPALAERGQGDRADDWIWLGKWGAPLLVIRMEYVVRPYLTAIGIPSGAGSCHLLRHAFASHLLAAGADVAAIAAMLGHAGLQTAPIYTHVSDDDLARHLAPLWPSARAAQTGDFRRETGDAA